MVAENVSFIWRLFSSNPHPRLGALILFLSPVWNLLHTVPSVLDLTFCLTGDLIQLGIPNLSLIFSFQSLCFRESCDWLS
jgi:hypothetical protein